MTPPGLGARRCFLFLVFFHLLPVPWYLAVAAGLAPASFLLMFGMAGLFNTDSESLVFAAMFLGPTIVAGLVFVVLSIVLAAVIGKIRKPMGRTLVLLALAAICVGIALMPVFVTGSHSGGDQFSLLDFLRILEEFSIPRAVAISYFSGLAILLCMLLAAQYKPELFPVLPRRAWRHVVLVTLVLFVVAFTCTHRITLVLTPLAELGFASQQYRLAMALKDHSGTRIGHDSREWLMRAAEQGHMQAAMELANKPKSAEDKLRWLTVAAEGGMAEAQYELYRLQLRSGDQSDPVIARKWLLASADSGHPLAQYELGKLYADGSDTFAVVRDPVKARKLWEDASKKGHGQATNELAWRYNMGAEGFKRDPEQAIKLYEQLAEAFANGSIDLPQNKQMSDGARQQAEQIAALEEKIAQGDSEALFKLGSQLIDISRDNHETVAEGFAMLEQAAESGRVDVQYFLGAVFMFGNYGQPKDFPRGQVWWGMAADNNHVKAMGYLAKAYQNGNYGYRVDLLKSKELTSKLVAVYREGLYGVEPDEQKADRWSRELKHFDRLFEVAGGSYQPLEALRSKADSGDAAAQYQLGRQLLVSGASEDRKRGYALIEQSAEAGYAEAQYRLVIYYENHLHIMRDNPERGVALLRAAANQDHLPAMGALALAYYKGRYGLPRDYYQAKSWYERILAVHKDGKFLGEIDDRFIGFQQRQLGYTERALVTQLEREERIANASPLELQVIAIEDCYRKEYERAVNALDRRDGSKEGKARFRVEVDRLSSHYKTLREQEVDQFKAQAESAESAEFVCLF
jgi:TPR repeat protein